MTGLISLGAVAFGTLMMKRLVVISDAGTRFYPLPVIITLLGLLFVIGWLASLGRPSIMRTPEHKNSRRRIMKSELSHMWPLFLFVAVYTLYTIYATSVRYQSHHDTFRALAWGLDYLMYAWALMAGYVLGRANRRLSTEAITYFVLAVMGISFVFVLGDYLSNAGFANFIGTFIHSWNNALKAAGGSVFILPPGEPVRASGLETYPFRLAIPTVMAAAWALSAKGNRIARTFIHVFVIGILLMSGARGPLIAYAVIILVALSITVMHLLIDRLGLTKVGGAISLLAAAAVIIGLLGVGYALVPAKQAGTPPSSSYERIISNVSFFKYEVQHNQLDGKDLNMLGSGRWARWSRSAKIIKAHPLGSGVPYRLLAKGTHAHNDILAALVWGGPFMLLALLLLYWWMAFMVRTPSAPYFGLYLAVGIAFAGLTDSVIIEAPYLFFGLFLLAAARRDIDRNAAPHFSWDTL